MNDDYSTRKVNAYRVLAAHARRNYEANRPRDPDNQDYPWLDAVARSLARAFGIDDGWPPHPDPVEERPPRPCLERGEYRTPEAFVASEISSWARASQRFARLLWEHERGINQTDLTSACLEAGETSATAYARARRLAAALRLINQTTRS